MELIRRTQNVNVNYLVSENPYNVPVFQRGEVWDTKKKSSLIASVLEDYGFPPLVVIRVRGEKKGLLLDGLQRFTALRKYIEGGYKLQFPVWLKIDEELRAKVEGKKFDELPEDLQAKILNAEVSVIEYEVPESERDRLFEIAVELFNRLNNKPTPLSKGQLMFMLSYDEKLSPELARIVEEANKGEDKKRAGFRTLARYLAVLMNYDLIKSGEGNWKATNFYDAVVGETLVSIKRSLEEAEDKDKLVKEYVEVAENFRDYALMVMNRIYNGELSKLKREGVLERFEEEYRERLMKNKEKAVAKLMKEKKLPKEEAERKVEEEITKLAHRKALERIDTLARKKANEWKISKKSWIADLYAVFEFEREKMGVSAEEFMERVGFKAFEKLMGDEEFNKLINDRKKDSPQGLKRIVEYVENTIEEVKREKEEKIKEEKRVEEEAESFLGLDESETVPSETNENQVASEVEEEEIPELNEESFELGIEDDLKELIKKRQAYFSSVMEGKKEKARKTKRRR